MLNCIFVGLGGFVGSILRYLVGLIPIKNPSGFPINTFLINVFGSLAIGVIACLAAKNSNLDSRLILFLKVGISLAVLYIVISVSFGALFAFLPQLVIK